MARVCVRSPLLLMYPLNGVRSQGFVRNCGSTFRNHPASQNPVQSRRFLSSPPFRAQSARTVLSHVLSPAPVPFSHISALQTVSVLPLQRTVKICLTCTALPLLPLPPRSAVILQTRSHSIFFRLLQQLRVRRR